MAAPPMAMFPLGGVLLPGEVLPLHVFEPRYRTMVDDLLAEPSELGVVLIERGSEVGGGDARFDVGCAARIVDAARTPDGRWALAVVGLRRIAVVRWLADDPYPRAEVVERPDPRPGPDAAARAGALVAPLVRALALAAELGEGQVPSEVTLPDDPVAASYLLASLAPVGPLDKLRLLAAPSVEERLGVLDRAVDEATTVLATRLGGI